MIALVVTVTEEGRPGADQFAFIKSPVRIGRGELNDLPLRRPFVSAYHALIQFDDAAAHYVDLGSLNESYLDGAPVEPNRPTPLAPGAEVRIGTLRLAFARKVTNEQRVGPAEMTAFAMRASSLSVGPLDPGARPPVAPPVAWAAASETSAAASAAARAVAAARLDLDLDYTSYRAAWEHLRAAVERTISGLEGSVRDAALEQLASLYPGLGAEAQFAALLGGGAGAPTPAGQSVLRGENPHAGALPSPDPGTDALRLLRAFCESYLPGTTPLVTATEVQAVLARVAAALETLGRSFVALRSGYEEFGKEIGVGAIRGEGALSRARDAREVLAHVLDPRAPGRDRELQRGFAEFMIHQMALLRGVAAGAQAILAQLSPEAIAAGAPQRAWLRAPALWRAYAERFREVAGEESAVSAVLFGKEFARAYSAIVGKQVSDESEGAVEPPGTPGPEGRGA